ncbi:MAG: hypothetical protein ACK5P5_08980 [Pseudobdellovibrionaceae bacterium]|jgi:hypothetical protein
MTATKQSRHYPRKFSFFGPMIFLILLLLAVDSYLFAANLRSLSVEIKKMAREKNRMILSSDKDFDLKVGQNLNLGPECKLKVEQVAKKEILVNYKVCAGSAEFAAGNKIFMNVETK